MHGQPGMTANEQQLLYADTLWGLLAKRAALTPDQLILIEGDHKHLQATALECLQQAERLAAGLYALGIGPGTIVSWQMPTRLHTLVLKLALARLGAVQNPILHLFRERELRNLLSQTRPEWFLVPGADRTCNYPEQGQKVACDLNIKLLVLDTDWPEGDPATLPPAPVSGDDVRWMYCTSGTTSGPKAVLHTDSSLMAGGHALNDSLEGEATDVTSVAYPVAHIGGAMVLTQLLSLGIPAVLLEKFEPNSAAEAFRRHGVTMTGGSTAHYQAWLNLQKQAGAEKVLPSLRMLTGGGASKPAQYYFQTLEALGVPIVHAYGMTESPLVASNRLSSSPHALAYTDGKPVSGMEVRIIRADGSWADQGEVGEVVIRGKCLCKGYLNPEQTREAFDDQGYYHTGDLASFDTEGNISLSGRLKDIIIRKGENISAREIEELLIDYPGVKAVAVIGLPDEERGERVCAVLECQGQPPTLADITGYLAEKGLMRQKLPEQLEIVEVMPRSEALGKVSKKDLQKRFS